MKKNIQRTAFMNIAIDISIIEKNLRWLHARHREEPEKSIEHVSRWETPEQQLLRSARKEGTTKSEPVFAVENTVWNDTKNK